MKPLGSNLDLEHSNGACWMCLKRGENGTRTFAPVDLGDAVPQIERPEGTPVSRGHDRRFKGGRRSKRAHCGGNSEGAWSRREIKARAAAHAVQKLVLQLRPRSTARQTVIVEHMIDSP